MLARGQRITRGDDYRRIVRSGQRVGGAVCITHAVLCSPDTPARFGFIITKAIGHAPQRNLIRRRMKAVAHQLVSEGFSGAELVIRALPASATASFSAIHADMSRAAARLQAKQGDRAEAGSLEASAQ
ncbi:ribonuclease P protein component [Leucobacter sp. M11]|uniref:ribonuclease P protein component n=1 Tax=Leucobacter sp. M11 TaxID=2993565 RepID=UPI002D80E9F5|nr:ribonuclease P protein component [Leucobacter sp. M11]MEB4614890.1 ribonuclease P protein component [Leucobacter sp. M11]